MYSPPLRSHYESMLSAILGQEGPFKSSKLLQAYVTFSAMVSSEETTADTYQSICKKYTDYKNALLRISNQQCKALRYEEMVKYVDLQFQDFLTYVTPDVVCAPSALMAYYHNYNSECKIDQIQLLHHVIAIKLNSYQTITTKQLKESTEDTPLGLIYRLYKAGEKFPLPFNVFKDFYFAVNVHPLNSNELAPRMIGSSWTRLSDLLAILFDDLQLTRTQSLKMVRDFFCENLQAVRISKDQEIYNFIENKDSTSRVKLLNKALKLMAKFSPLELICAISLRKKDGTANERNKTEAYIVPNDITLENSLVYTLFFSGITPGSDSRILIILPSPLFVNKVLWSSEHNDSRITFIFDDKNISELLNYQRNNPSYAPAIGNNMRFITYQQWIDGHDYPAEGYANVLLFGTRLSLLNRIDFISMLTQKSPQDASLLVLEPSRFIESGNIAFDQDKIITEKIALIPQGINNSTHPRRKVLIRCKIYPTDFAAERAKPIELHTYTLNTVFKTQALSPMHEKPVLINRTTLCENTHTLRQMYSREIILRYPAGRERNPSFSHEITPDIVVWCSKTYPKDNRSRPRLEAYVCEPAPSSRINSGFTERGSRIKSTIKHTTSIPDEEILHWLENVYPYSIITPKSTNCNTNATLTVTSVRDEIISTYTEYLRGQNIALKTLWYLYPSLADCFSKSSYEILSAMMNTLLGEQRVCDLTAELCEYLLVSEYPNLSQNSLWARFAILSTALDQAVLLGYCASNHLRDALRQANVRDKLFAQVRNALTKKHFTKSEQQKAYAYLVEEIEKGQPLFLGVLLRLMTGLESKIICALRWCDLQYSPEYNMYSAIIARKIRDDGTFEGFYDNEDYMVFPISAQLQSVILHMKKSSRINNDNQLILGSLLPPESKMNSVAPSILNQLTRKMILALGIDDRIVSLPYHEDQMRETDLNKYSGDIIRQNFRFWATEAGKLNADELSYLLRNKPATTLGCYYCDFLNEASQLMLQIKLNRIDAIVNARPSRTQKHMLHSSSNYKFEIGADKGVKKSVLLELSSKDETDIEICINSHYGITYEMTSSGKEDSVW